MESGASYIPIDRLHALARGEDLPERANGAALFADISGFTPLTEALVRELGPQRGPEELTNYLNLVYDALVNDVHRYGGSVLGFSGDAMTCWFGDQRPEANDQGSGTRRKRVKAAKKTARSTIESSASTPDTQPLTTDPSPVRRAAACAVAMQAAMSQFASLQTPAGTTISLGMKVAVAAGAARRFIVGDPAIQLMDALAGTTLERLATAEHHARRGEIVLDEVAAHALGDVAQFSGWIDDQESGERFAVLLDLNQVIPDMPWPPLQAELSEAQTRLWLLPPVYERLRAGLGDFLTELRPAAALFLRFGGLNYDSDPGAAVKLDAYVRQVQRALLRYEAFVVQLTIGDKGSYMYVAFGAPVAHEDDGARAAAAALELQSLPAEDIGAVQIGLSQGRMRAGAYGGSSRRTYGILGDEVNLAARLMSRAAPGEILLSSRVRKSLGEGFVLEALPPAQLKGIAEPVPIFRLAGERTQRATRMTEPTYALPMVGRLAELALIDSKIGQTLAGAGQVVGVVAEAGMGKSRLVAEAVRLARRRGMDVFGGACQSYGTNSPYLVWEPILRGLLGIDADAPPRRQFRALEGEIDVLAADRLEALPLLAPLLGLSIPENDFTRALEPRYRKTALEALVLDCVRALAQLAASEQRGMLIVLEDLHWIDPLSHDLLEQIAHAIETLPVLFLLAYRPPDLQRLQTPRVEALPYFTRIELSTIAPDEAEQIIRAKLAQLLPERRAPVLPALVTALSERAQGNPFYVEELLSYLHDRGIDPFDSAAVAQVELPASLQSLILSRIDQLAERQKATLRFASVIGRLFRATMLWGAYPQIGAPLDVRADLDALSQLELTPLDQPEPELSYLFKHIVTQEVAYESMPFATRATLHDLIGSYLEQQTQDGEPPLDLLAFHYDRSRNGAKRREYLQRAGEAAQNRYANETAIDYYRRLLPLLPESERPGVMLKLGPVLEVVGQWDAAHELYREAYALAEQHSDQSAQAYAHTAIADLVRRRGQFAEAAQLLDQAQSVFESLNDQSGLARVLHVGGTLAAQQGDLDTAQTRYESSLALRHMLNDKPAIGSLLSNLGIVAAWRGNFDQARVIYQESLEIRRTIGDRWAISVSLNNIGNLALDIQDYAAARLPIEEAVTLMRGVGDRSMLAIFLNTLANANRELGDYDAARGMYHEALQINRELGDQRATAYLLEDSGVLAALQSQHEQALQLAGAATALRELVGAPLAPPEQEKLDSGIAPARAALGPAAEAALAAGRAMIVEQAVWLALGRDEV